ncbi:MAG: nucleotidyltransferase domain-containing protein [Bacteroidales bacterium]|nr:nucleotidyltransferase domain-containing protein [Bacteroidales bacterium]MBQ4476630.1 nucleotidyltransferase domain-containing protein [Bacteroidales bacterium]
MDTQLRDTISSYFATQPVQKAWLFGSYARGEETADSDVDILVVFDKDGGKSISLLKHIKIALDLEDILGKKVDLITEGTLMPFAQETAEKDKILIYERTSYIDEINTENSN